jgi:hypothetical protein
MSSSGRQEPFVTFDVAQNAVYNLAAAQLLIKSPSRNAFVYITIMIWIWLQILLGHQANNM